jgi:single-stranded-DNA-specific exonuclease
MEWRQRTPIIKTNSNDEVFVRLCKVRGIKDIEEFFNPSAFSLHDPYGMDNIMEASARIIKAIHANEKICISADCDADGVFSTATMVRYIRQFTENYYIIYNQRSEGHGIENHKHKVQEGTGLLVILDSSTNSAEACKEISESGTDIVILDHHAVENENPYAIIVNPQQDKYENKELSGAGVVFKAIQVMDDTMATDKPEELLDLVACGMYADIMSVDVMENRYIMLTGIRNIKNQGLKAILRVNNIEADQCSSTAIGWNISPFINHISRNDMIEKALEILLEDDFSRCLEIAHEVKKLNESSKAKAKKLEKCLEKTIDINDKVLIGIHEEESKSMNGVIATKYANKYKRPAIIVRDCGGTMSGSFRSYSSFNMKSFLSGLGCFNYALGHEQAGGVEFKTDDLDKIKTILNEALMDTVFESDLEYDMAVKAHEIDDALIESIADFNILTGKGFPKACFRITDIFVEERKVIGKGQDTVKLSCDNVEAIKFQVTKDWAEDVGSFDTVEIIGSIKMNEYMNMYKRTMIRTKQIEIDDLRKL